MLTKNFKSGHQLIAATMVSAFAAFTPMRADAASQNCPTQHIAALPVENGFDIVPVIVDAKGAPIAADQNVNCGIMAGHFTVAGFAQVISLAQPIDGVVTAAYVIRGDLDLLIAQKIRADAVAAQKGTPPTSLVIQPEIGVILKPGVEWSEPMKAALIAKFNNARLYGHGLLASTPQNPYVNAPTVTGISFDYDKNFKIDPARYNSVAEVLHGARTAAPTAASTPRAPAVQAQPAPTAEAPARPTASDQPGSPVVQAAPAKHMFH